VPTVNVLAIFVFARYAGGQASLSGIARSVATNPLIVASALGVALKATGLGLPSGIEATLRALGQASLPLGLLCVGAAFDLLSIRQGARAAAIASAAKFLALPAVTFGLCRALEVTGATALVAMLFQSLPTATSAYILARHLGGDAPLMAGIIAFQTVLASIAIPLALLAAIYGLGG
jgi:malonate transporter and related proteins